MDVNCDMMFSKSAERRVNVGKASWTLVFVRHGCTHTHIHVSSVCCALYVVTRAHMMKSKSDWFRRSHLTSNKVTADQDIGEGQC